MKFEISRVSSWGDHDPNIPGAYRETRVLYEDSDEIVEWFVDIHTIEELMALRDQVKNDLILGLTSITVYDDYME